MTIKLYGNLNIEILLKLSNKHLESII